MDGVTKLCSGCKQAKPVTAFAQRKDSVDGRRGRCRECFSAMRKDWRAANLDERRAYEAALRERTRDSQNAKSRDWYSRNAEAHKATVYRWRAANPERARAITAKYARGHRDVLRRRDERRRLRMREVWTPAGDEYAALISNDPCVYCGGPSHGVDHIVPVADGGEHVPGNLAAACLDCNRRKRTKPLLHFLLARAATNSYSRPDRARWTG